MHRQEIVADPRTDTGEPGTAVMKITNVTTYNLGYGTFHFTWTKVVDPDEDDLTDTP